VQQFTSETPEQTMPESWLWVKNLEQPHCREQIFGVNEQAVQPWWFVPLSQGRIRANVRRGEIHKVVARSPDLATSPTEGLQPRPRRETCGPAGPPERGGRGLETRAEQRLRIWISRDPQGGGGLDRSAPGARGRGPIRGRSGRAARSRIWEGVALPPEPVEAREPPTGEGGGPSEESAPDRADRARERGVSEVAGGGVASRSRSFAPVVSSGLVARPSRLVVERVPGCAPSTPRGEASSRSARLRARL